MFSSIQPIDTTSFIFRNNSGKGSANILGKYNTQMAPSIVYSARLLQEQFNGIFDTDGSLLYDKRTGKLVYVYYYRNEFFTADQNTVLLKRGHTIDTISKAKIKVASLREGTRQKMAAPPLLVNAKSALKNNLLFVESKIQGRNENQKTWKYASIIDVYDVEKNSYVLSFPVFVGNEDKLKSFLVTQSHFYALAGSRILKYRLSGTLQKEMRLTRK